VFAKHYLLGSKDLASHGCSVLSHATSTTKNNAYFFLDSFTSCVAAEFADNLYAVQGLGPNLGPGARGEA
jgi:hypothetical protein